MMQISTTQFDNKFRRVDLHAIRIGDKFAHQMQLTELHALGRSSNPPRDGDAGCPVADWGLAA
jgi:hypothetical protein